MKLKFFSIIIILSLSFDLIDAKPSRFNFTNYNHLKTGQSFEIFEAKKGVAVKKIGTGKIYKINSKNLHLDFKVSATVYSVSGNVKLRYIGIKNNKLKYILKYYIIENGSSSQIDEIVYADSFLTQNGIFSIKFSNKKRFLQMSINSNKQNRLITEWGSAILK